MAATLKASLVHWKKKLERITDEEAILATIHKLSKVPITLELLQDTGIGKTIRTLAKKPGKVGSKSSQVLLSWRDVVATSQETPDKHSKHSSHKKELSNGDKSHDRHSSSSHEKHKSKHSSDSNHKQKHLSNGQDSDSFTTKSDSKEKHRKSNHSSDSKHKHVNHSSESKYKEHEKHKKSSKHSSDHKQNSVNEDSNNSFGSDSIERKVRSFDSSSKKPAKDDTQLTFSMTNGGGENLQFETNGKIKSFSVQYNDKKRKHESPDGDTVEKKPKIEKPPKSETSNHKKSEHKEEKVKVKHEHKSEKSQKDKNARMKVSSKPAKVEPNEGFTASEVRFEDCLGFNDMVLVKKKKAPKTSSEKKKPQVKKEDSKSSSKSTKNHTPMYQKIKTENFETDLPSLLQQQPPTMKEVDILSTLPQTQPNYRPLPQRNYDSPKQKKVLSNEEAIMFTSSRREKTSVYSGKKSAGYTEVPTLLNACIQVLIENIDAIEYMGGVVPYFVLKQVLVKCTPQQLYNIEDYNPYLLEDTQELWEVHYKKEFRNLQPQENETWRDAYLRAVEEREMKFRNITANISASMSTKYKPGRQVKLAYVDSFVKPPRDVARKQAKNGTALPVNLPVKAGPPSKATPRPTAPVINAAAVAVASTSRAREIVPKKPKVAPLMAKTLKSMKQCFRR